MSSHWPRLIPHGWSSAGRDFYGLEAARAICRHGQAQPPLTLRIDDPSIETELIDAGVQLEPGALLTAARTVVSGDVIATAAFREGRVRVQDEGSQLIAELAACAGEDLDQKGKSNPRCLRGARRQDAHPRRAQSRGANSGVRIESAAARRAAQASRRVRRPRGVPPRRRDRVERRIGLRSCLGGRALQRHRHAGPQS